VTCRYAYIEFLDLVSYVCTLFPRTATKPEIELVVTCLPRLYRSLPLWCLSDICAVQVFEREDRFTATTVKELLRSSVMRESRISCVSNQASLWLVFEELARTHRRRIAATDPHDHITHIITQSQLLALIAQGKCTPLPHSVLS
jgi:hypothetical protein